MLGGRTAPHVEHLASEDRHFRAPGRMRPQTWRPQAMMAIPSIAVADRNHWRRRRGPFAGTLAQPCQETFHRTCARRGEGAAIPPSSWNGQCSPFGQMCSHGAPDTCPLFRRNRRNVGLLTAPSNMPGALPAFLREPSVYLVGQLGSPDRRWNPSGAARTKRCFPKRSRRGQ